MPDWLQGISNLLPTTWAAEGFAAATWRGLPYEHALVPALVLLGFAGAFVAIGAWRFRWS
jgi:ABC-type multidrug transport system permease subunit